MILYSVGGSANLKDFSWEWGNHMKEKPNRNSNYYHNHTKFKLSNHCACTFHCSTLSSHINWHNKLTNTQWHINMFICKRETMK